MPEPFDLGNQPPDPGKRPTSGRPAGLPPVTNQGPPPQRGQLPTSRASDMLRAGSKISGVAQGDPNKPGPDIDRRATPFDDLASGTLAITGILFLVGVGYLLWGMWSGSYAEPNWSSTYQHADRARALANVQLCGNIMWPAIAISTVLFLFLFYHEDFTGYALLGGALLMQLGIPYATTFIYSSTKWHETIATDAINHFLSGQSWVIGIPGFILTIVHMVRSAIAGLDEAKLKRSHMQFGAKTVKDHKPRNVFLGACWNLPYCKDSIRSNCPIFVKKSGPCWRNKRGCMCDQTILLVAQSPNWKQSVNATVGKLEGKMNMPELPPQPQLSKQAKIERCRQCVIFNYHQEQKYKLIVGLVLGGTAVALIFFNAQMLALTGDFCQATNDLLGRFSTSSHATALFAAGAPAFVEWLILSSLVLVSVAKTLQFAEYVCFRLKI